MKDIIIIGGGPSAMSAAVYAARMNLNITLITDEFGGHVPKTDIVENYLGFKSISGIELNNNFEEHLKSYDVEIIEDEKVKKAYEKNNIIEIELENNKILKSKYAIIATGSKRRELGVKGEKEFANKGVTYCAVCDGPLFKDQNVAVIGGSYSGTKSAIYLSKIAKQVYIIELDDKLKGENILIDEINKIKNIEIITKAKTTEIYGNDFVEGLKYEKDNKINDLKVNGITIEIGLIPNSDIIEIEKNEKNQIIVDDDMRTSNKKIFAVGDVNNKGPEQIIVAAAQGCIAALKISEEIK
ncbi:MAG: NAD(P)/FAD-dependent oxidoreductase [Candidatus Woesearchaeota archaeon]